MEWLEPWWPTESLPQEVSDRIAQQLAVEVPSGHVMYGLPVKLIARGNGNDALFEILDGRGRIADVHLTWSKGKERLPWPIATIYPSLAEWAATGMVSDHMDWSGEA
jgi:hypothetical protein